MRSSRRTFLATVGLGLLGEAPRPAAARDSTSAPTVILVHGEFVDATIWREVVPLLASAGLSVVTLQIKARSTSEDVAELGAALDSVLGDAVLVEN